MSRSKGLNHTPLNKRTKLSKRSSLSIKDCLEKMSSPREKKSPGPLHQSSVSIKTTTVPFQMKDLKEVYANGFKCSQSQSFSGFQLIGPLKSHGSWVCCRGNSIEILNTSRIEEAILHHRLMQNHVLKAEKIEPPINLSKSDLNCGSHHDLYMALVTMAQKSSTLIGSCHYIHDKRLTANGFDISWVKDVLTGDLNFQLVGLPPDIPAYGVADLREILELTTTTTTTMHKSDVSGYRPIKVINYLTSEAVRIVRQTPLKTQREDVEELLDQLTNQFPPDRVTCLHDKPFYHDVYDLSHITLSQSQSTQSSLPSQAL